MHILLTGGAGFIGSHVADAYLAAGHKVTIIDDFSVGKGENIPQGAMLYKGSILDSQFLTKVFAECRPDLVNHHAAQISVVVSVREPVRDAQLNVLGTVNILQAAKEARIKKIIYATSGGSMYGDPTYLPCPESAPASPQSFYALSKETAEHYVWMYARLYGMAATVLRYANIFGPRQDPLGEAGVCAIFAGRMLADQPVSIFGDGSQQRDYVYVKDVAAANVAAVEVGTGQSYNIGTGIGTTTLQVFEALKKATAYTRDATMAPGRSGEVQATYLDPGKAARELHWQPQYTFEQGIAETIEWYRGRP